MQDKANQKYEYRQLYNPYPAKALVCPQCYEALSQVDIQHFPNCPYCNHDLEMNDELEEYILEPYVEHWVHSCTHGHMTGPANLEMELE